MLGDALVTVRDLRWISIHGVPYADLALEDERGRVLTARLGPEAVPDGLAVGDSVVAVVVMANVLELRRPDD